MPSQIVDAVRVKPKRKVVVSEAKRGSRRLAVHGLVEVTPANNTRPGQDGCEQPPFLSSLKIAPRDRRTGRDTSPPGDAVQVIRQDVSEQRKHTNSTGGRYRRRPLPVKEAVK